MPTNVTPEYKKAEEAFRNAGTLDEKVERLEDMIALLPKHKGTDHLYADLKRRLSKLRKDMESAGKKARSGPRLGFTREGAAQVVLVGPPNSGKSSIVAALTNAHPDIGDYPFTTNQPQPAMLPYQDIQFQLVDSPPVTADYMPMHLLSLVRGAEAVLLVADLSKDTILEEIDAVFDMFAARHVTFVGDPRSRDRDVVPARVVANKLDAPEAAARLGLLREAFVKRLDVDPISCREPGGVKQIAVMLFEWLGVVRVYTKAPGHRPEMEHPYTVFEGQTVGDICRLIHKDFVDSLRFARLWRGDTDAITVARHEQVLDRDIVELHM